jgi:hypothetical protein
MLFTLSQNARDDQTLCEMLTDLECLGASVDAGMEQILVQMFTTTSAKHKQIQPFMSFLSRFARELQIPYSALQLGLSMPDNSEICKKAKSLLEHYSKPQYSSRSPNWSLVTCINKSQDESPIVKSWKQSNGRPFYHPIGKYIAIVDTSESMLSIYGMA